MKMSGIIVNGQVQLDQPADLPDGTRVTLLSEDEFEEEFEHPHPLAPYDSEKESTLIRERIAAVQAGEKTIPLDEAMEQVVSRLHRNANRAD